MAKSACQNCGYTVPHLIREVEWELLERCPKCGAYQWEPPPVKVRVARAAVVIAALGLVVPASAHWAPQLPHHNARHATNLVWCGRSNVRCAASDEAWSVARCESTLHLHAANGQYLGLWQLGSFARQRFGPFAWNPWAQARAAFRYYYYTLLRTGYGWYPWTCRP